MAGKKGMKKYPKVVREQIIKEFHEGKINWNFTKNMELADMQYNVG